MLARGSEIKRFLDADLRPILAPDCPEAGADDISWEDPDAQFEVPHMLFDDVKYDLRRFGCFAWRGFSNTPRALRTDVPFMRAFALWQQRERDAAV